MGFYDLESSGLFGSVGLAIDMPETSLELSCGQAAGSDLGASKVLAQIMEGLHVDMPVHVSVLQAIPSHAGLGSGTQMAMAIGAGLSALLNLKLNTHDVARIAGRGKRSGIGVAAFEQGGFLVDARNEVGNVIPQVIERLEFPEGWRIVLVQDSAQTGVHGPAEKQAFQALKPASGNLREMVLTKMVPALKRQDLAVFERCVASLQTYNGDYFAPIQGGRYASKDVGQVLEWVESQGIACVGQSSWGPTGFAIVESEASAQRLLQAARQTFQNKGNISFNICRGRNCGAVVQIR